MSSTPNQVPRSARRADLRLLWWSVMVSAILWTIVFRVAHEVAEVAEFIYVAF